MTYRIVYTHKDYDDWKFCDILKIREFLCDSNYILDTIIKPIAENLIKIDPRYTYIIEKLL